MTATKILAVAIVAALSATWYSSHLLNIERTAHADTRATYAAQVASAERVAREQSEKYRATEQELRDAQETHATEVKTIHLNRDRALARAVVESRRLQDAANAAAARARAQCSNTTTSDMGPPADDAIGVLAYVLGRADERAGILADIAEQRGIAGRACERAYDEAREALMK
jgi:Tfp pilus assembly protein PilE